MCLLVTSIEGTQLVFFMDVCVNLTSRRLPFVSKARQGKVAVETKQTNKNPALPVCLAYLVILPCWFLACRLPQFCLKVTSSLSRQLWGFCLSEPPPVPTAGIRARPIERVDLL